MTYTVRGPGSVHDNILGTFTSKRKALVFAREQAQQIDNVVDVYQRGPILPAWVEGVTRPERIATFWPR